MVGSSSLVREDVHDAHRPAGLCRSRPTIQSAHGLYGFDALRRTWRLGRLSGVDGEMIAAWLQRLVLLDWTAHFIWISYGDVLMICISIYSSSYYLGHRWTLGRHCLVHDLRPHIHLILLLGVKTDTWEASPHALPL